MTCITFVARQETVAIELPEIAWKHQQGESCIVNTNLVRPDLQRVFVKRFRNSAPDAHQLLVGSTNQPLPHVPSLLHCENQDGIYYYIFPVLDGYKDLEFYLHPGGDYSRIMGLAPAHALLTQMMSALEIVNQRGYFHPDVCWRNIMAKYRRDQIPEFALIDIDSCQALTGTLPDGTTCDQTWWSLYLYKGLRDPAYLNQTMVLSIGLVFCHLLGQFTCGISRSDARRILLGRPDDQRGLFAVLEQADVNEFIRVFCPRSRQSTPQIRRLFAQWQQILTGMENGSTVPWTAIRQFTDDLMVLQMDPASPAKLIAPVLQRADERSHAQGKRHNVAISRWIVMASFAAVAFVLCAIQWQAKPYSSYNSPAAISDQSVLVVPAHPTAVEISQPIVTPSPMHQEPSRSEKAGTPAPAVAPPLATLPACADAVGSRLYVGAKARVAAPGVNLRSSPKVPVPLNANVVLVIGRNQVVAIVDGPSCAHQGYWWKVTTKGGESGWIREEVDNQWLLAPLP